MKNIYKRICPRCNKEISYSSYKTHNQAVHRNSVCRSCRTTIANMSPKRNNAGSKNPAWKGVEDIPYSWFSKYFERSNRSKRKGTITLEQVCEMWNSQNRKCALSGVSIGFRDCGKTGNSCSIDRIDSNKEYTIDNIQLVHKDVNRMKSDFDQEYFINLCKLIVQKNDIEKSNNTDNLK